MVKGADAYAGRVLEGCLASLSAEEKRAAERVRPLDGLRLALRPSAPGNAAPDDAPLQLLERLLAFDERSRWTVREALEEAAWFAPERAKAPTAISDATAKGAAARKPIADAFAALAAGVTDKWWAEAKIDVAGQRAPIDALLLALFRVRFVPPRAGCLRSPPHPFPF